MITAILTLFGSILSVFAPALGEAGLMIITAIVSNKELAAKLSAQYQASLNKHKNDGAVSAGERKSDQDQVAELQAEMAAQDAASVVQPIPAQTTEVKS